MRYKVDTDRTVDEAAARLGDAVREAGLTVAAEYDLQRALVTACHEIPHACHMLEVCNTAQAVDMLRRDMDLAVGVTCRLAVYDHVGQTRIAMLRPTRVLGAITPSPARMDIAKEIEQKMIRIIDRAR